MAAAKGHSECVVGDGILTIKELVAIVNSDPRRGEAYSDQLGTLLLSAPAIIELNKQGLTVDSIPEAGRTVVVRRTGDLTTDCTDEVHAETAEQAVIAARVVGFWPLMQRRGGAGVELVAVADGDQLPARMRLPAQRGYAHGGPGGGAPLAIKSTPWPSNSRVPRDR